MTRSTTLLLLAAVALLGSCKSSPGKVCDKLDELAARASTEGDEPTKKMATSIQAESSTCLTRMQAMEQKDPEQFARTTTCIDGATDLRAALQCFFTSAMEKTGLKKDGAAK